MNIKIIYLFFASSIILISGILPFVLSVPQKSGQESLVPILALLALGVISAAFYIENAFMKTPSAGSANRNQQDALSRSRRLTGAVIGCALKESVAVFGLVIFFLTGNQIWPQIFGAAALLALIVSWPASR